MTQQMIIVRHLRDLRSFGDNDGWIKEGLLNSKETRYGFIGFAGSRRVRELVESGYLERRKVGRYAEVRYKVKEKEEMSVEDKLKNYIQ